MYAVMVFRADSLGKSRGNILGLAVNIKVSLPHRRCLILIELILFAQTSVTLTVCNLLVVVTYVYNRFRSNLEDSDSESEDNPTTRRHSDLPGGRTTKPSVAPPSTVLVLTDIGTESTGVSCGEGTGGTTSTPMTWDGSDRGWVARTPPPALTTLGISSQPSSFSGAVSELSSASVLPSGSAAKSASG